MKNLLIAALLFLGIVLTVSCNETTRSTNTQATAETQEQEQSQPTSPKNKQKEVKDEDAQQQRPAENTEEQESSQNKQYKGFLCTGDNEYIPLTYTKEYTENGNKFITVYKISSPDNGYYLDITATHYKSQKKIIVSVDDVTVNKEFGHISTQEISYENPSLKMFGRANIFAASGMDAQGRLPNDLALKFVNNDYKYVKVVHVARDKERETAKWYVLDEKN